jgi:hypothetical protein
MVEAIYELLISQLAQDGSVNETNTPQGVIDEQLVEAKITEVPLPHVIDSAPALSAIKSGVLLAVFAAT